MRKGSASKQGLWRTMWRTQFRFEPGVAAAFAAAILFGADTPSAKPLLAKPPRGCWLPCGVTLSIVLSDCATVVPTVDGNQAPITGMGISRSVAWTVSSCSGRALIARALVYGIAERAIL